MHLVHLTSRAGAHDDATVPQRADDVVHALALANQAHRHALHNEGLARWQRLEIQTRSLVDDVVVLIGKEGGQTLHCNLTLLLLVIVLIAVIVVLAVIAVLHRHGGVARLGDRLLGQIARPRHHRRDDDGRLDVHAHDVMRQKVRKLAHDTLDRRLAALHVAVGQDQVALARAVVQPHLGLLCHSRTVVLLTSSPQLVEENLTHTDVALHVRRELSVLLHGQELVHQTSGHLVVLVVLHVLETLARPPRPHLLQHVFVVLRSDGGLRLSSRRRLVLHVNRRIEVAHPRVNEHDELLNVSCTNQVVISRAAPKLPQLLLGIFKLGLKAELVVLEDLPIATIERTHLLFQLLWRHVHE